MTQQSGLRAPLDTVITDYLKRVDRGEHVDRQRFMQAHHGVASELEEFFHDLDFINHRVKHRDGWEMDATADITRASDGSEVPNSFIRLDARHWVEDPADRLMSFGDYDLIQELGRGGMGIVFKARQRSLNRIVCVKMMLMAELAEVNEYKRFRAEATAIARLSHPGIVAIHEVGQYKGTPYYSMEYIEGSPLSKCVVETPLPAPETTQYVLQIADAIQVAHDNGIVHRDLKPSNVLVDENGRTHITDFGLAKHLEAEEDLTVTGQVLGTPAYMSPEQGAARRGEVGPAADIYALGAILYALLTGRPPHRADGVMETVRQVMTETPVFPRVLNARIPRDLETICMKCLEKSPSARYATAAELAGDMRRYLAGEPILARRLGTIAAASRWVRRHPSTSLAIACLALLAIGAATGLTLHNSQLSRLNERLESTVFRLDNALVRSRQNELRARNLQYVSDMQLVEPYALEGDYRSSNDLLQRNMPPEGKEDLRGFEWYVLQQRQVRTGEIIATVAAPLYYASFSPDGKALAVGGADGELRIYKSHGAELLSTISTGHKDINGVAYSVGGNFVATAGGDGSVCIWDVRTGQLVRAIAAHQSEAFNVQFLRDDSVLLSCGADSELQLWDVRTGAKIGTLKWSSEPIDAFAVTRNERSVWVVAADGFAVQFDLDSYEVVGPRIRHSKRPTCVAVAPDGILVITGEIGERLMVANSETGEMESIATSHPIQSVAVSQDGRLLAAGDRNGAVRIWSIRKSSESKCGYALDAISGWHAHEGRVYGLTFSPQSDKLVSVGSDGQARGWNVKHLLSRDQSYRWAAGNSESEHSFTFLPGSPMLASANPSVGVELWDCETPCDRPQLSFPLPGVACVGCDRRGDFIAAGTQDGVVAIWNRHTQQLIRQWPAGQEVVQIAFSPRQDLIAVVTFQEGSAFRQTQLFHLADGTPCFEKTMLNWRHVAFSPAGDRLYVALDETDQIIIWDVDQNRKVGAFNHHDTTIRHMALSPGGEYVVSASNDRAVMIYNTLTQTQAQISTGLRGDVEGLLLGPRNTSVVIADSMGTVRVCNLRSAKRLMDLVQIFEPGEPKGLAMSSDSRYVAVRWRGQFLVFDMLPRGVPEELMR